MDATQSTQPDSDDFSSEPVTVVIPRQSTKDLVAEHRAELQRQGLVAQDGAK